MHDQPMFSIEDGIVATVVKISRWPWHVVSLSCLMLLSCYSLRFVSVYYLLSMPFWQVLSSTVYWLLHLIFKTSSRMSQAVSGFENRKILGRQIWIVVRSCHRSQLNSNLKLGVNSSGKLNFIHERRNMRVSFGMICRRPISSAAIVISYTCFLGATERY